MVTIPYAQLQNIAIPAIDLLPHNFKISPTIPMELFWIDIELITIILFWSRKVSIIITIVSDITVLVSHNVILFGYIMPMNYGINKKTAPSDSCNLPHLISGFHEVCLLFYNKYFINLLLLWPDYYKR